MIGFGVDREAKSLADAGFRALFERSLSPMLLIDDTRNLVDANRAACLLLRLARSDLVRRRVDDLIAPGRRAEVDPDWRELLASGTLAGRYHVCTPGTEDFEVEYSAIANIRPGLHLSILVFPPGPEGAPMPPTPNGTALTRRERQVISRLAMGLDGPQIAAELGISNPTVQTHVRNAMGRLGARTRAQAVALALTRGEIGF